MAQMEKNMEMKRKPLFRCFFAGPFLHQPGIPHLGFRVLVSNGRHSYYQRWMDELLHQPKSFLIPGKYTSLGTPDNARFPP